MVTSNNISFLVFICYTPWLWRAGRTPAYTTFVLNLNALVIIVSVSYCCCSVRQSSLDDLSGAGSILQNTKYGEYWLVSIFKEWEVGIEIEFSVSIISVQYRTIDLSYFSRPQ